MKVVFEGLQPEQAVATPVANAVASPVRADVRFPRKSRVQLHPIAAEARLFHAFYA